LPASKDLEAQASKLLLRTEVLEMANLEIKVIDGYGLFFKDDNLRLTRSSDLEGAEICWTSYHKKHKMFMPLFRLMAIFFYLPKYFG